MWKRDESPKPAVPPAPAPAAPVPTAHTPAVPSGGDHRQHFTGRDNVNIGKSVVIKGELSGSEDLTIEGNVEGKIELRDNTLTIGPNGKIRAEVFAKQVIVLGEVTGNVTASEKVDIRDNGSVDGDVTAPRVAIAEGAHFRGAIDMQQRPSTKVPATAMATAKPTSAAASPASSASPTPVAAKAGA
jgi:cytoskeletal protein CcmA (bactofilin family)